MMARAEEVLIQGSTSLTRTDVPPIVMDPRAEERAWARECVAPWIFGGLYQYVVSSHVSKEDLLAGVVAATNTMTSQALEETADALFDELLKMLKVPEDRPERADAEKELEGLDWLIVKLSGPAHAVFEATRRRKGQ